MIVCYSHEELEEGASIDLLQHTLIVHYQVILAITLIVTIVDYPQAGYSRIVPKQAILSQPPIGLPTPVEARSLTFIQSWGEQS